MTKWQRKYIFTDRYIVKFTLYINFIRLDAKRMAI